MPIINKNIFKRAQRGLFHGKMKLFGNNISPSRRHTRRTFTPNVIRKHFYSIELGTKVKLNVTTAAMRQMDRLGGLDNYLLHTRDALLGTRGVQMKRDLQKRLGIARKRDADAGDVKVKNHSILIRKKLETGLDRFAQMASLFPEDSFFNRKDDLIEKGVKMSSDLKKALDETLPYHLEIVARNKQLRKNYLERKSYTHVSLARGSRKDSAELRSVQPKLYTNAFDQEPLNLFELTREDQYNLNRSKMTTPYVFPASIIRPFKREIVYHSREVSPTGTLIPDNADPELQEPVPYRSQLEEIARSKSVLVKGFDASMVDIPVGFKLPTSRRKSKKLISDNTSSKEDTSSLEMEKLK